MVRDRYAVRLAPEQREELQHLIRVGKRPARVTARARILLKSDDGWPAPQVAEALDVALGTVYRVKQRFTEEGLAGVLKDRPQANRRRKLDDRGEAHLIALACSPAPEGHDHCNLRLLADRMVKLGVVDSLSHETVRLHLKKSPQAVAEETVVHSQGECRLRGSHGGCPGFVCRTLQSRKAGGLLRRDIHSVAGRRPGHPSQRRPDTQA